MTRKLPHFESGRRVLEKALVLLAALSMSAACGGASTPASGETAGDEAHTVLITGANRGIGLELARQYAADGWQVIGTARRPGAAEALRELGAEIIQLDVTDADSVAQFAAALAERPVDILINNAGILPYVRTLEEVDFDDFERVLAVNTTGPVRVTHAILDNVRAGRLKTIVNMTSNVGSITENTSGGMYGYRESKAALNMFTRSLAADFADEGFTCIALHPGWVQTDMGGPNAPTRVEDSARGIRSVIGDLSPDDNGRYLTFEGRQMPW